MKVLAFLFGALLLAAGLIEFFLALPFASKGDIPGGIVFAPMLGVILLLGLFFLSYGLLKADVQ